MFSSEQWLANSGADFYNGVATQSLRFDRGGSTYLNRTPSSTTNNSKWTWSGWVKRGNLDTAFPNTYNYFLFGASNGTSQSILYYSSTSNALGFYIYNGSSFPTNVSTDAIFRDTSAWYHVVFIFDCANSTASDRVIFYVNGERQTTDTTASTTASYVNQNVFHTIGIDARLNATLGTFDGYMAEVNFVDGLALDPTYFGETKNGVWIAKKYTGSYGTNGFRLKFDQVGVGTASTSTIGADTSGNTNHFTSSGIVASDCAMPDSPENNFCTLNPTRGAYGNTNPNGTLAEGNLKFSAPNQTYFYNSAGTIFPTSGKWYWEVFIVSNNNNAGILGIVTSGGDTKEFPGWDTEGLGYGWASSNGNKIHNNTSSSYVNETALANDIAGIALDLDNGTLTFYHNNASQGQAFSSIDSSKGWSFGSGTGYLTTFVANFGQDSSFAGNKTAQGNTDANGIGDFYYAPPSGYLALCTANLPEPTIGANSLTQADDHFNTVLWTGDNNARSIDDVGFQPDWLWTKSRSNAESHRLHDSSRGDNGTVMYELNSDNTEAEGTDTLVTGFDALGFNIAAGGNTPNVSGRTYVAWNWKANGGTTSSNTDGSITSTVQANTDAGFSIVTATSLSSGTWSFGHGLSKKPDMIIQKYRAGTSRWTTWHKILTSGQYLGLNETNAIRSSGTPFNFNITDSVIGGNINYDNGGQTVVYYVFHSVEGYSKFGSYTGNSNNDGTFVYTGFRPAMVMVKRTTGADSWFIYDIKRNSHNVMDKYLLADTSGAEGTDASPLGLDMVSNGFKWRINSGARNTTGQTYIYMAFADSVGAFKYANAR